MSLHYTGTLLDGTKFDSSRDRNQPFEFQLGTGAVIRGFEMGVPTMKKGETCILTCAPEYAYGANGSPPNIPPNSTLNFELEMLGWKGEDVSPNSTGEIERFILTAGEGQSTPGQGDHVDVHVEGKYNGQVFDERDLKFDLIEAAEFGLCKGVELGVEKMHRQETARFVIKQRYAFGKEGNEKFNIPPGATIEYTVTLKSFTSIGKVWKMDEKDLLNRAQITKDRGVEYVKKERYETALNLFKFCGNFLDKDGTSEEIKKLKLAVALNTALCHQKLSNHAEGKNACNEALELDPENVKALYRRGQFFFQLWDLDEAEQDFNQVSAIVAKCQFNGVLSLFLIRSIYWRTPKGVYVTRRSCS